MWKIFVTALCATTFTSVSARAVPAAGSSLGEVLSTAPLSEVDLPSNSSWSEIEARDSVWPTYTQIVSNYFVPYFTQRFISNGIFYNHDFNDDALHTKLRDAVSTALGSTIAAYTIYDAYLPDIHYNSPFQKGAGIRKVYDDLKKIRDWFRLTSATYASQCIGKVYLVWDWDAQTPFKGVSREDNKTPWTAIWSTDEFPQIFSEDSLVTEVWLIHPIKKILSDGPAWVRGQKAPTNWLLPAPIPPLSGGSTKIKRNETLLPENWEEERDAHIARVRSAQGLDPIEKRQDNYPPGSNGFIQARPERTIFSNEDVYGWDSGQCTFHWTQTKVHGDVPPDIVHDAGYPFSVGLYDDGQCDLIGVISRQSISPWNADGYAMPSRLPYTINILPGIFPDGPVRFEYANLIWRSDDDAYCKTGGYTAGVAGVRTGDCWFPCNPYQ